MTLNLFTAVNQPDIDIIFNFCVMGKVPFVLVEGMEDIPKYHEIFSKSSTYSETLYIEAIENIENYSLGCDEIIRCIDDLYTNHPQQHNQIDKYIISIIDKDIRDLKNTLPIHNTHIILKEYSVESIFVSKESVEILLKFLIKGPSKSITNTVVNNIFQSSLNELANELYYASLDALNFSLNSTHKKIRYKYEYGFIENNINDFLVQISTDSSYKNSLDNLSNTHSLNTNLDSLKIFVKGKWLYRSFIKLIINSAKDLTNKCKLSLIQSCSYCKINKYDQCLYKTISTQGYEHIDNHLFKNLPMNQYFNGFDYIIHQFELRMNNINQ